MRKAAVRRLRADLLPQGLLELGDIVAVGGGPGFEWVLAVHLLHLLAELTEPRRRAVRLPRPGRARSVQSFLIPSAAKQITEFSDHPGPDCIGERASPGPDRMCQRISVSTV